MEGGGDRQQHGALHALFLGDFNGALNSRLGAGNHHLAAAIVVRGFHHLGLVGFGVGGGGGANFLRQINLRAQKCGHGASAGGGGLLHGLATQAQKLRGGGDIESAGGGQRAIFAKRMPSH